MQDNNYGYAGKILRVNLSTGKVSHLPTSDYTDRFIGGRGMAAKLYWDLVPPESKALDPENCIIFATGPTCGFGGLSGSRCQVVFKSPASIPEHFAYCNIGGHWPVHLKLAGYDAMVVEGVAEKPVYLVIKDDNVEIKDAAHLWGKPVVETRAVVKSELGNDFRVLTIGPAGENSATMAIMLGDSDASGSMGSGAVWGSKKLKAIAVRGTGARNLKVAKPNKVRDLVNSAHRLLDEPRGPNARIITEGLTEKKETCPGCFGLCSRTSYTTEDGVSGKFMCQSGFFYSARASRFYGQKNDVPFRATRICDTYGVDTWAMETMLMWMVRCIQAGILTDENTGLPMSQLGSMEFIEKLVRSIALREGFGDILANGITRAAAQIGGQAPGMIADFMSSRADQLNIYGPRHYIATGIFNMMDTRYPIQHLHEYGHPPLAWVRWKKGLPGAYMSTELLYKIAERFWGSKEAADFSTYEGKALAAKMIQDRQYAIESLILCDFHYPMTHLSTTEDGFGDPTMESQIYSAVTGRETSEQELYGIGERIVNLQRAIMAREGHRGRNSDQLREVFFTIPLKTEYQNLECLAPGKDGEMLDKRGSVVDREKFENMKTEYYQFRDWDPATGLQTKTKLSQLALDDVAAGLVKYEAVV